MIRSYSIVIGLALGLSVIGAPFWIAVVAGAVVIENRQLAQAWRQDHGLNS